MPVIGALTIDQLDENCGALDVELSSPQHDRITTAYHED